MVSNMVTGGLVSGLGWVLGAQPVERDGKGGSVHEEGNGRD
jgi:protein transport protein SEC39